MAYRPFLQTTTDKDRPNRHADGCSKPGREKTDLEDISFSAANCRRAAVGSEPADSTKMRGVMGVESA